MQVNCSAINTLSTTRSLSDSSVLGKFNETTTELFPKVIALFVGHRVRKEHRLTLVLEERTNFQTMHRADCEVRVFGSS